MLPGSAAEIRNDFPVHAFANAAWRESQVHAALNRQLHPSASRNTHHTMQSSDHRYTHSQKRTLTQLLNLAELHFSGLSYKGALHCRPNPLIAGPTGAGKSFLVEEAARECKAHYFKITYGDWIAQGARHESTMSLVLKAVAKHPRVLFHIDELDKYGNQATAMESTWGRSIQTDIWNVLDFNLPALQEDKNDYPQLEKMSADQRRAFVRSRLWIVGSGTWQMVFNQKKTSSFMGFNAGAVQETPIAERIRDAKSIPDELTARFHSDILIMEYPFAEEEITNLLDRFGITQIAEELGTSIHVNELQQKLSTQGMRVFESLMTNLLVEQLERKRNGKETSFTQVDSSRGPDPQEQRDPPTCQSQESNVSFSGNHLEQQAEALADEDIDAQIEELNNQLAELKQEIEKPNLNFSLQLMSLHEMQDLGEIRPECAFDAAPQYAATSSARTGRWMNPSPSWYRRCLQAIQARIPLRPTRSEPECYHPNEDHACQRSMSMMGLGALELSVSIAVEGSVFSETTREDLMRWRELFEEMIWRLSETKFLLGRRPRTGYEDPRVSILVGMSNGGTSMADPYTDAKVLIHEVHNRSEDDRVNLLLRIVREIVVESKNCKMGHIDHYVAFFNRMSKAASQRINQESA
jgi:hypothetical protein